MAKKKKAAGPAGAPLTESAHRIWLAGLGALATAEREGGKLFRSLVARGADYETRVKTPVERAGRAVRGAVDEARSRAGRAVDRVEAALDERIAEALTRLGIPTRKEISDLSRRVERLTAELDGGPRSTARKKTAKAKTKASARNKPASSKSASRTGSRARRSG